MRRLILSLICFTSLFLVSNYNCNACSSVCLKTLSGVFFGANLDLQWGDGLIYVNRRNIDKAGYLTNTLEETAKWTSKYGSLTFNLVGREFAWCGMNEAGLVISTMYLDSTELPIADTRPPLVSGFWVQFMLDNCQSVSEVIAADSLVRLADDKCHFLVADSKGNCATIEFLDGKLVYHTSDQLPITALTNDPYQILLENYNNGTVPQRDLFHSVERFQNIAEKLSDFNAHSDIAPLEYTLDIMTQTVKMKDTKWSIIFDIEKREIYFQTKKSPTLKYIQMDEFNYSCNASEKMLDVNSLLTGDISSSFIPYNHSYNLSVFKTFCERWGVDVSDSSAEDLIIFIEEFSCSDFKNNKND